jgi:hypothetical protein
MNTLKLEASIGARDNSWGFDYSWECPVPNGLTKIHQGLLQKGFGEILRDASSTCKVKDAAGNEIDPTPEDRNRAVLARLAKIQDGTYVFGGGGTRGPSLSVEVAAWIAYFKSKGCTVKLVDTKTNKRLVPSGENLDQFQTAYAKAAIWPSVSKILATMDKPAQVAFHKEKLPSIIAQHKEHVIRLAESDEKAVKPFVDSEKLRRGNKPQDDGFHVEIEIDM